MTKEFDQAKEQIADLELNIEKAEKQIEVNEKAEEVLLDTLNGTKVKLDAQYDRDIDNLRTQNENHEASLRSWDEALAEAEVKLDALNPPVVEVAAEPHPDYIEPLEQQ